MRDRFFLSSQRVRLFLVSLGLVALAAPAATGALKKYTVKRQMLLHYAVTSPHVEWRSLGGVGRAIVDESGADPILKKLVTIRTSSGTTLVPGLSGGIIWFNRESVEGPGPDQVGTGSSASTITWGDVQGWTITGGTFCMAAPSYICSMAAAVHEETVDAALHSTHYDIGTWTFHGTGFRHQHSGETSDGFIYRTAGSTPGNLQYHYVGSPDQDGTVPALPLLGIGAVGVSVFAMGVASVRRRRE